VESEIKKKRKKKEGFVMAEEAGCRECRVVQEWWQRTLDFYAGGGVSAFHRTFVISISISINHLFTFSFPFSIFCFIPSTHT